MALLLKVNETELLSYCLDNYLSVSQRWKYLEKLGVLRIHETGEPMVNPEATVINKEDGRCIYEKANSLIDYILKKNAKRIKGEPLDLAEVEQKVNKLKDEDTITADEIPF
jgi:hypothetical protein